MPNAIPWLSPKEKELISLVIAGDPVDIDTYGGIKPELRQALIAYQNNDDVEWNQLLGLSPVLRRFMSEAITPIELNKPTDLHATRSYNSIYLTWTNNSVNKEGTSIFISTDGVNWDNTPQTTEDDYNWDSLDPDTTYHFKVQDFSGEQTGPESDPIETSTLDFDLLTPTDLSAEAQSDTEIRLDWTDVSINGDGQEIQISYDGVEWVANPIPGTTAEFYVWGDLDPDTQYWFRVRPYKAGQIHYVGEWSTPVSATTEEEQPLVDPMIIAPHFSLSFEGEERGDYDVSTDGGDIWSSEKITGQEFPFNNSLNGGMVLADKYVATLLVDHDPGNAERLDFYTSTDGENWVEFEQDILPSSYITENTVSYGATDRLHAVVEIGGLDTQAVSYDGETWDTDTAPPQHPHAEVKTGEDSYVITCQGQGTESDVYSTTDGGTSWTQKTSIPAGGARQLAYSNGNLVAATSISATSELFYSDDGGDTWSSPTLDVSEFEGCRTMAFNEDVVLINYADFSDPEDIIIKLYRSIDGGETWTDISSNLEKCFEVNYVGNGVFAGVVVNMETMSTTISFSEDGGDTWSSPVAPQESTLYKAPFGLYVKED